MKVGNLCIIITYTYIIVSHVCVCMYVCSFVCMYIYMYFTPMTYIVSLRVVALQAFSDYSL